MTKGVPEGTGRGTIMPEALIHEACRRGDVDAVRALIAADPAAVDADDEHGWRPIFHAGLWRHEPVARLLIESGADLAAHDGYVLHYAGEVPDNKAIVALLVQYGALEAHVRPADDLSRQLLAAVFLADAGRVIRVPGNQRHSARDMFLRESRCVRARPRDRHLSGAFRETRRVRPRARRWRGTAVRPGQKSS